MERYILASLERMFGKNENFAITFRKGVDI